MSEMFNVGTRIYLIDRVSRDLERIGGVFMSTAARVATLQRGIDSLGASRMLAGRRAQLAARVDRDALAAMNARYSTMLASGNLESDLVARRALHAKIIERTERGSIRRDAERLALQRNLTRQTQLQAAAEAELAAGAARRGMLVGGAEFIGSAIGLDLGVHAAKAAAQLQVRERTLQTVYGYTRAQTNAQRLQAFGLQQRLGNMSAADVEQMRLTLLGAGLSKRTAGAVLPETALVSDVLYRVRHEPIQQTAAKLAQFANLMNLRTAAQFKPFGEILMKASLIAPGSMSELLTQSSYLAPLMRRGFSARSVIRLATVAQREGGRGAISPENLATLLARMQVAANPLATHGLAYLASIRLGIPKFLAAHPHFNMQQMLHLFQSDRARLGSPQFLAYGKMLFGVQGLRTLEQLSRPQTADMLEHVRHEMRKMGTAAQINARLQDTLTGQTALLATNFKSLAQVIGGPLIAPLQAFNHLLAATVGDATTVMAHHKTTTSILGRAAFTSLLFGAGGGLAKLSGSALKFLGTKGWLPGGEAVGAGLDTVSTALSQLFPYVMAAQVGTQLGGVVAKKQIGYLKQQTPHGRPLPAFGTFGGYPFLNISPAAAAPAPAHSAPSVHIQTVNVTLPNVHDAKGLIKGLRNAALSHGGVATPMSYAHAVATGNARTP